MLRLRNSRASLIQDYFKVSVIQGLIATQGLKAKGLKAKGFFRNLRIRTREEKKKKKNAIT